MTKNSPSKPAHLLFIKPGSMGDVIHSLPVATAIHHAWPETRLTWIIDPRWEPLLANNPAVTATHPFPRGEFRGVAGIMRFLAWCRTLRELNADAALDLQCLLRSGLMARFSGAHRIWGLSDAREGSRFFYTHRIDVLKNEHSVHRYLRALPAMEIPTPEKPEWVLPGNTPCPAVPHEKPFVVIHPFSRGVGKSLDDASFEAFLETFRSLSTATCVLVGAGKCNRPSDATFLNLLNQTTLGELTDILRRAAFVVSVDSGPMHLAAALGTPLLSIHTWSDPRRVGPLAENAWIWQGGEIRRQNLVASPLPEKPFTSRDASEVAKFVASAIGSPTQG